MRGGNQAEYLKNRSCQWGGDSYIRRPTSCLGNAKQRNHGHFSNTNYRVQLRIKGSCEGTLAGAGVHTGDNPRTTQEFMPTINQLVRKGRHDSGREVEVTRTRELSRSAAASASR